MAALTGSCFGQVNRTVAFVCVVYGFVSIISLLVVIVSRFSADLGCMHACILRDTLSYR